MKYIISFSVALMLFSCKPDYPYRIEGQVMWKDTLRPAIWYTDTFSLAEDSTLYYFNSNGSKAVIHPPYKIYKTKK